MAINSINYYAAYARAMSNISNSVNRSSALYGNWYTNLYGSRYGSNGTSVNSVSAVRSQDTSQTAAERLLQEVFRRQTYASSQTSSAERAIQQLYESVTGTSSASAANAPASTALENFSNLVTAMGGGTAYQMASSVHRAFADTSQSDALAASQTFVKEYSSALQELKTAAENIRESQMRETLGEITESGEYAQENIDKAVSAVKNMVSQYNQTVETLTKNLDRGSGVQRQVNAVRQRPVSEEAMEQVGLGYNADGQMVFREEVFVSALKQASQADKADGTRNRVEMLTETLDKVGSRLSRTASAGLMRRSDTLIANDLQKINNQRITATISAWNNVYSRSGLEALAGAGSFFSAKA